MQKFDRITIDLARMNGEPCIRDLRVTVRRVLEALAVYPTVLHLNNAGIEALHVGERGLAKASDSRILDIGRQEEMVVTLDADFHALLALSGATGPSVIRIRIEGLRAPDFAACRSGRGRFKFTTASEIKEGKESKQATPSLTRPTGNV